ncbi:MAG TPA: UDP-N-acetylglucosamine 2-epimerase (non-hydrolyzing) [Acidimicrobiales bacterium]|nr:UDP-N-acetylglucosamine 2-epimerase (non-hydrolyzing) [Acidimicrobiales bacterium]
MQSWHDDVSPSPQRRTGPARAQWSPCILRCRGRLVGRLLKVLTVIGARPQFVKSAIVSAAFAVRSDVKETVVDTGQHYDPNMSSVFFNDMAAGPPKYSLNVGSGSHAQQTAKMLAALEPVFEDEAPDVLLVYGDTNSTLAGALCAAKLHVPIAHVEAGLRSFNRRMPEEVNRVMVDHLSDMLFAPTTVAVHNLEHEGLSPEKVHLVGDVMYDASLRFRDEAARRSDVLEKLELAPGGYILATVHRAENTGTDARLREIFAALERTTETLPVVLPLHPRTRAVVEQWEVNALDHTAIHVLEPVGYLDMVQLEANSAAVVTDSGGVQKEAYFYGVPCVTLREETEWTELVDSGWNRLVTPDDADAIVSVIAAAVGTVGTPSELYGDGHASEAIVNLLVRKA